ncbi:MAG: hypothetical protein HZA58_03275 [Acidimicrobiia bacterium]|nr:hypothetical protein [Acidimicrobiia bacterium]
MKARALVAVGLVLGACSTAVPEAEPFAGVWASEGWGIVLDIHGGEADIYEISSAQCLLASSGSARNIDEVVSFEGQRLVLDDGGRVVRFDRLEALPAACAVDPDPAPATVLATVVAAVEEHYHPGVDAAWEDRLAALVVPPEGDTAALAAAVKGLLAPLGDPQVALQSGGDVWTAASSPVATALAIALGEGALLPDADVVAAGGLVVADLGGGVRYLGFLRLGGFADSDSGSQRTLAGALDLSLEGASRIVLDLRATAAGAETEALLVATRFVASTTVVATYEARLGDGSMVASGEAVAHPMPTGPFAGSVVLLIGPGTSGPAELLALALADLPGVTVVGEPTAGSPRSPLVRSLPNGWLLGVPNIEVTTADGMPRVGVPLMPDVMAPLTIDDITAGHDPGLEAAVAL